MPEHHAKISPSSFSRVMACPASLQFSSYFLPDKGEDTTNRAAEEGTAQHEAVEYLLNWQDPPEVASNGIHITPFMLDAVHQVTDWTLAQSFDTLETEIRLPIGQALGMNDPDLCWGTSDIVATKGDELWVIDAKFGRNPVSPENNAQAMMYLIGALFVHEGPPIKKMRNVIIQPAAGGVKIAKVTKSAVTNFGTSARAAIADAFSQNPPFIPGDTQCQWCPRKGACRAFLRFSFDDVSHITDPAENHTSPEDLATLLNKEKAITAALKAAKQEALDRLASGQKIPGWMLSKTKPRAKYKDEDATFAALIEQGFDPDDIAPRKMAAQSSLAKLVGKDVLAEHIMHPEPGLAIAKDGEGEEHVDSEFSAL